MKSNLISMLIFILTLTTFAAERKQEIVTFDLDPERVYTIKCHLSNGITTIMFPGEPEAIAAANVATSVDKNKDSQAAFLISCQPGSYYFCIRALYKGATGSMNVTYGRRTYILKLEEDQENAMSSVTFRGRNAASAKSHSVAPAILKGLIDKSKMYDTLKEYYPVATANVEYCNVPQISTYKDYTVTVQRAWRYNEYDALVFWLELKNSTDQELRYAPRNVTMTTGKHQLHAALIDASGVMPPKSSTNIFICVTGTTDGGKNHLSAKNEWHVLLHAQPKKD